MTYECRSCGMSIEALTCHKCQQELVNKSIEIDGKTVQVCSCQNCKGMIKSPQCCGKDMSSV